MPATGVPKCAARPHDVPAMSIWSATSCASRRPAKSGRRSSAAATSAPMCTIGPWMSAKTPAPMTSGSASTFTSSSRARSACAVTAPLSVTSTSGIALPAAAGATCFVSANAPHASARPDAAHHTSSSSHAPPSTSSTRARPSSSASPAFCIPYATHADSVCDGCGGKGCFSREERK